MSKITLECEYCKKKFERERGEYNRNKKIGRKIFCSLSCNGKQHFIDYPSKGNPEFFVGYYNNRLDEYSSFKKYLRSARSRCKTNSTKEVNITLQDLKEQWELQEGICPFTGWQLELPVASHRWNKNSQEKNKASIDRIDSSRGYVKGNIQFVARMANHAKSNLTRKDVIEFCKAVAGYHR